MERPLEPSNTPYAMPWIQCRCYRCWWIMNFLIFCCSLSRNVVYRFLLQSTGLIIGKIRKCHSMRWWDNRHSLIHTLDSLWAILEKNTQTQSKILCNLDIYYFIGKCSSTWLSVFLFASRFFLLGFYRSHILWVGWIECCFRRNVTFWREKIESFWRSVLERKKIYSALPNESK